MATVSHTTGALHSPTGEIDLHVEFSDARVVDTVELSQGMVEHLDLDGQLVSLELNGLIVERTDEIDGLWLSPEQLTALADASYTARIQHQKGMDKVTIFGLDRALVVILGDMTTQELDAWVEEHRTKDGDT